MRFQLSSGGAIIAEQNREKPYPAFPLNWHKTGYSYKRLNGKVYYFGERWGSAEDALEDYLKRRDNGQPLSGGTPARCGKQQLVAETAGGSQGRVRRRNHTVSHALAQAWLVKSGAE